MNIDLCFVPASHEEAAKLPAVSGSSGKLVVERSAEERAEQWYPGQVFGNPELSYREAMAQFVADSQAGGHEQAAPCSPQAVQRAENKAKQQAVRQTEAALRVQRRQQRQRRKAQDQHWREERAAAQKRSELNQKAQKEARTQRRKARQAQLTQRKQEDEQWRQQRQELRQQQQRTRLITTWIAILLITDNCTRQCSGLPLFSAGSHVTAQMVTDALRQLLPDTLQFLISDRGVHFTAAVFKQLAQEHDFIHVLIARHRPQSNGIAERFVRTLKEWLRDKSWQSAAELETLLTQFRLEYNDRPHQGLPIPGLSPNEFAARLSLF